jgi:hypothetical protein
VGVSIDDTVKTGVVFGFNIGEPFGHARELGNVHCLIIYNYVKYLLKTGTAMGALFGMMLKVGLKIGVVWALVENL